VSQLLHGFTDLGSCGDSQHQGLQRTYPDPEGQAPPVRGVTKNNSPREAQGHRKRAIVRGAGDSLEGRECHQRDADTTLNHTVPGGLDYCTKRGELTANQFTAQFG
jgi:hypothetical protein